MSKASLSLCLLFATACTNEVGFLRPDDFPEPPEVEPEFADPVRVDLIASETELRVLWPQQGRCDIAAAISNLETTCTEVVEGEGCDEPRFLSGSRCDMIVSVSSSSGVVCDGRLSESTPSLACDLRAAAASAGSITVEGCDRTIRVPLLPFPELSYSLALDGGELVHTPIGDARTLSCSVDEERAECCASATLPRFDDIAFGEDGTTLFQANEISVEEIDGEVSLLQLSSIDIDEDVFVAEPRADRFSTPARISVVVNGVTLNDAGTATSRYEGDPLVDLQALAAALIDDEAVLARFRTGLAGNAVELEIAGERLVGVFPQATWSNDVIIGQVPARAASLRHESITLVGESGSYTVSVDIDWPNVPVVVAR